MMWSVSAVWRSECSSASAVPVHMVCGLLEEHWQKLRHQKGHGNRHVAYNTYLRTLYTVCWPHHLHVSRFQLMFCVDLNPHSKVFPLPNMNTSHHKTIVPQLPGCCWHENSGWRGASLSNTRLNPIALSRAAGWWWESRPCLHNTHIFCSHQGFELLESTEGSTTNNPKPTFSNTHAAVWGAKVILDI